MGIDGGDTHQGLLHTGASKAKGTLHQVMDRHYKVWSKRSGDYGIQQRDLNMHGLQSLLCSCSACCEQCSKGYCCCREGNCRANMQVPTVTSRPTCSQSGLQVCMTKGELGTGLNNPARPRLAHSRAGQGRAGQGRAGQAGQGTKYCGVCFVRKHALALSSCEAWQEDLQGWCRCHLGSICCSRHCCCLQSGH